MNREKYDEYLRRFNNKDYHGLLEYFDDEFSVEFAGSKLQSRQEVLDFYTFFHSHTNEQITVTRYLSDDDTVCMEADVKVTCIRDLPASLWAERGFPGMASMAVGDIIVIPQFIHYHLRNGKFTKALCAVR